LAEGALSVRWSVVDVDARRGLGYCTRGMTPLASKILIVGIPLVISLTWFLFWVFRLAGAARRIKNGVPAPGKKPPPPSPPAS
jgi:hypothetical protein